VAQQAQDTFVAVLKDGTERLVKYGEVLADSHELVRSAPNLFRTLDLDDERQQKRARVPRKQTVS